MQKIQRLSDASSKTSELINFMFKMMDDLTLQSMRVSTFFIRCLGVYWSPSRARTTSGRTE